MNRLLMALVAGAFASVAVAQTPDPKMTSKERQETVKATTGAAANSTTGATTAKQQEANVKASKSSTKMTSAEKNKAIKDANTKMVNPDNSSGTAATAGMQKETTAASKATAKQRPNINTPEGQKAMQKAATP
jgi:hypothetical protein